MPPNDQSLSFSFTAEGAVAIRAVQAALDGVEKAVSAANRALDSNLRGLQNQRGAVDQVETAHKRVRDRVVETAQGLERATKQARDFATSTERGAEAAKRAADAAQRAAAASGRGGGPVPPLAVGGGFGGDGQPRDASGRFLSRGGVAGLGSDLQGSTIAAIGLGTALGNVATSVVSLGVRIAASGLDRFVSTISTVTGGVSDLTRTVVESTEKFEKFSITIEGALKSSERAKEISNFVQQYALRTPQRVEELQDLVKSLALIPTLKPTFFGDFDAVKLRLEDLFQTVIGLASLDPTQGIPGAVFALREALGGQLRSLQARFEILPAVVAGSIGKTVAEIKRSPPLLLKALKQFVEDSVGPNTLARLGALPSVRVGNIIEGLFSIAPRQIGQTGVSTLVQTLLGTIDDSLQSFLAGGGPFESKFAPKIGEALQRTLLAAVRIGTALLGAGGIDTQLGSPFEAAASGLQRALERVAGIAEALATELESPAGQAGLASAIDNILSALESFFNGLQSFVKAIPQLLPFMAQFVRVMAQLVEQVFSLIGRADTALENLVAANPAIGGLLFGDGFRAEAERVKEKRVLQSILSGGAVDLGAEAGFQRRNVGQIRDLQTTLAGGAAFRGSLVSDEQLRSQIADLQRQNQLSDLRVLAGGFRGNPSGFVNAARTLGLGLDDRTATGLLGGPGAEAVRSVKEFAAGLGELDREAQKVAKTAASSRPLRLLLFGKEVGLFGSDERGAGQRIDDFLKSGSAVASETIKTSIATLKNLGLESKDRVETAVLTPLERAAKQADETRTIFETSIASLDDALKTGVAELNRVERLAIAAAGGNYDAIDSIIDRTDKAREALVKLFTATRAEADRLNASTNATFFLETIKELVGVDAQNPAAFAAKLGAARQALTIQQPLDFAAVGSRTIGTGLARQLAGFSFGIGRTAADDDAAGFGLFGRTSASQIAVQERMLSLLRDEGGARAEIRALISDARIAESDRAQFQTALDEALEKEVRTRERQLVLLRAQKTVEDEQRSFDRGFGRLQFDDDRLTALAARAAELQQRLRADDGALGAFLGISAADPRATSIAAGYREKLTEDLRVLGEQAEDLQTTLDRASRQRSLDKSLGGRLGAQFGLFDTDAVGRPKLKGSEEIFAEAGIDAAVSFAGAFRTSMGDTIYSVFKGQFDGVAEIASQLGDTLTRIFADAIADILFKQQLAALLSNVLGIGGAAGGGGSGIVPTGNVVGSVPASFTAALGGIYPPWGGSYAIAGTFNRPTTVTVGEGGRRELVAPLNHFGQLPLTFGANGLSAMLPGGRQIPTTILQGPRMSPAQGSLVAPSFVTVNQSRPVYVVNVLNPAEITRMGLAANGDVVINQVAGDLGKRGPTARAILKAQ